jgi:hypothetical protein
MIAGIYHKLERKTLSTALKYHPSIRVKVLKKTSWESLCPGFLSLLDPPLFILCFLRSPEFVWVTEEIGARGSVVGWGTMLQAGRSRIRVPMRWIFFNWPNPSSRTMALGSTQPLTEMSTRNIPGGKERQVLRKADNLTAICEPIV